MLGFFVEIIGVEPMTSCMPCKRSSQLSYTPLYFERKFTKHKNPFKIKDYLLIKMYDLTKKRY